MDAPVAGCANSYLGVVAYGRAWACSAENKWLMAATVVIGFDIE